jgi:hypothetical protein
MLQKKQVGGHKIKLIIPDYIIDVEKVGDSLLEAGECWKFN